MAFDPDEFDRRLRAIRGERESRISSIPDDPFNRTFTARLQEMRSQTAVAEKEPEPKEPTALERFGAAFKGTTIEELRKPKPLREIAVESITEAAKKTIIEPAQRLRKFPAAVVGTAGSFLGALEWAGVEKAKPLADKLDEWSDTIGGPGNTFEDKVVGAFGSAATFFIPGLGLAKAARVAATVSPRLAALFGAGTAAFLESSAEAGDVYRTNERSGKSREESSEAATKTFGLNLALNIATNTLSPIFGSETIGKLRGAIKSAPIEAAQEFFQTLIANSQTGRPLYKDAFTSGAIGAIVGGTIGGITGATVIPPHIVQKLEQPDPASFGPDPLEMERRIAERDGLISKIERKPEEPSYIFEDEVRDEGVIEPIEVPEAPKTRVPREKPTIIQPIALEERDEQQQRREDQALTELAVAAPGQRVFLPGGEVRGFASTFPSWIPDGLRQSVLTRAVYDHIVNGTLPTKVDEVRLYNVVADVMGKLPKAEEEIKREINVDDISFIDDDRLDETIRRTEEELTSYERPIEGVVAPSEVAAARERETASAAALGSPIHPEFVATRERTEYPVDAIDELRPIGYRGQLRGRLQRPADLPGGIVSAPQIITALSRVTDAAGKLVPIRVGIRGIARRVGGIYRVREQVIRVLEANNIPTATHEVAHAIEYLVFGKVKGSPWTKPDIGIPMQRELLKLGRALYGDRQPAGGYKREGFAEYVRLWVTDPAVAKREAPTFERWFNETFLKEHEPIARTLERARELVAQWQNQGSRARIEASIVDPVSLVNRYKEAKAAIRRVFNYDTITEMAQPLFKIARRAEVTVGRPLTPEEDPFLTISALRSTHTARTRYMVDRAMVDIAGNPVGPSLRDAAALIRGKQHEFSIYLYARRAVKLWTDPNRPEGRNPGISLEDAQQVISELETPKFQLAAQKFYEWNDGVLNYVAQSSQTFQAIVERIRSVDPGDYVPLQREFNELDQTWRRTAGQPGSPFARLKGSGRRITPIFPAVISQASRMLRSAHERVVLDQILKLSKIEGMGDIIEEVPPTRVPVASRTLEDLLTEIDRRVNLEVGGAPATTAVLDALGEGSDLLQQTVTFFAPAQTPDTKEPIIPIVEQGKTRWFVVDPKLYDALSALDVYRLNGVVGTIVEGTLGRLARLFRAGTTGLRASFGLVVNPIRDPQTLWVNSRSSANGARLFLAWMRSMGDAALGTFDVKSSAYYDAFIRLGGAMAQPLGQDIPQTRLAARQVFQGRVVRTLDPRNWFDFIREILQFPEAAPRIAELRLIAKEIGWEPGTPMTLGQSLQLLLAAKQVTTDFTAAGKFSRAINRIVPFYNAAIQGPRANIRAARRNPMRFAMRGLQLTVITLLLWFKYKDEEWYTQMPYRDRFLSWHFPIDWPEPTLVRLPRAFEVGMIFSALPEAFVDSWYRRDPEGVVAWFKSLFATSLPNLLPSAFKETAEQLSNRDFFRDMPIVPMSEQRLPREEQFNEYTSRVAITFGELFNASPRRIDHAIRGIFGPLGGDVLGTLGLGNRAIDREEELTDTPIIGRLFQRGGQIGTRPRAITELYEMLEAAQLRQASKRQEETPQQRQVRLMLDDAAQAVSALSYVRRFTPETEKRNALIREALTIAKKVVVQAKVGDVRLRWYFKEQRERVEAREKGVKRIIGK